MPRRNKPPTRRRATIGYGPSEPKAADYEDMALRIVKAGRRDPTILERPWGAVDGKRRTA